MGKAKRKAKRNRKRREENKAMMDQKQYEALLKEQMEEGCYEEALNTLAKLAEAGDKNPQVYYDCAFVYYKLRDYERATQWVLTLLGEIPGDIRARMLLAKICLTQGREKDALAVLDFVAEHYVDLTQEQKDEIRFTVCGANMTESEMQAAYPHLAPFTQKATGEKKDPKAVLQSLRDKIQRGKKSVHAPAAVPMPESIASESSNVQEGGGIPFTAGDKCEEILSLPVSAVEKARLLNIFAGAFYDQLDFSSAKLLLEAARRLSGDDTTLKNLAYVLIDEGNREEARAYAGQLKEADFALLRLVRIGR